MVPKTLVSFSHFTRLTVREVFTEFKFHSKHCYGLQQGSTNVAKVVVARKTFTEGPNIF